VASRRMCHLLDFERLGRPLTGDSLLPFQLFWEQIRLRQFRRAPFYERKDRPELRPHVVPLPRRHSLVLGRRVTFTFAVAKFSGARPRRGTPPENFPLRLRLSTLTGWSKVGRERNSSFRHRMFSFISKNWRGRPLVRQSLRGERDVAGYVIRSFRDIDS
jgi:hypothetical protein